MSKIVKKIIDACENCPHAKLQPWDCECRKMERELESVGIIPNWCPLPDTEEQSELGKALDLLLEEEGAEEVLNWAKNEYPEFMEAAKDMTLADAEEGNDE